MMRWERVRSLLGQGVDTGVFSASVALVCGENEVWFEAAVGTTRWDEGDQVTPSTRFDLASVTKVMATTVCLMRQVQVGGLDLDKPLAGLLPGASGTEKASLTCRHLLAHCSGLPAWRPYFESLRDLALAGRFLEARSRMAKAVLAEPLEAAPASRCRYSDLGFMLLAAVLEAHTGRRLDDLWQTEVAKPLGLKATAYRPLDEARPAASFAATERCPWRLRTLEGEVHDDNAWVCGGIAGHAGLFGTARDVGRLASALLAAEAGRSPWLNAATVRAFWQPDPFGIGASYALGWDTPSPGASQAGSNIVNAVGHLGFTGTSLWIDLDRQAAVVLLTNRVHPTRANDEIKRFRPRFHDAVIEALDG